MQVVKWWFENGGSEIGNIHHVNNSSIPFFINNHVHRKFNTLNLNDISANSRYKNIYIHTLYSSTSVLQNSDIISWQRNLLDLHIYRYFWKKRGFPTFEKTLHTNILYYLLASWLDIFKGNDFLWVLLKITIMLFFEEGKLFLFFFLVKEKLQIFKNILTSHYKWKKLVSLVIEAMVVVVWW